MNHVSRLLASFDKRTKHDLVKTLLGTAAGFLVELAVKNAYESATKRPNKIS